MSGNFNYPKNNESICWNVKYDISNDGHYRNYVILTQLNMPILHKKTIFLIMLNPGSFDRPESFGKDTTLRNVRKAFQDLGYKIEILNLFNRCEPKRKELSRMNESERNWNNTIKERLNNYKRGDKVVIQWGKLNEDFAKDKAKEILQFIEKKGLEYIGLRDEKGYYYHPNRWIFVNGFERFKEKIIPKIKS